MKAKNFYLISELVRDNAIAALMDVELNGKTKASIGNAGSKSARQRGLQWIWYGDVANSGIGGELEETARGVSIQCKRMFAIPIVLGNADKYEDFIGIYGLVIQAHGGDEYFMNRFFDNHLHTEWFDTSEMAEFLTDCEIYYTNLGVNLSDPVDWKLLNR
ncbi:MAG: hypothetical protein GY938_11360 [Ketobacter sp.]|nr:hypothetical protein [Ketobacter sp.]